MTKGADLGHFSSDFSSRPPLQIAVMLPKPIAQALNQFILDNKTGNVRINIKDGRVLGSQLEQILRSDA